MTQVILQSNPSVELKFKGYPKEIKSKLDYLRNLILEVASESNIEELEETLKWGEPSYLAKKGSTLRMDWKTKTPNQYAMYFKCTSKLIETIRKVYGDTFKYEKNRAILFSLEDKVPKEELKECIRLALNYHSLKHLPLLGLLNE
ncbi:DUF1801 domain-containing protein [Maribacter algarum]|uniref:DUF1801 domain-containing protein n=1 Tax=Maribacter algarum (ex Zhang et al. 2020) TaxID=2578118 RepID=A0A5S3PQN2_9FLAO|nr:DUF1801 domain-containing protein [Maribacter algarum]TMM56971.1 DUF1801 domain-containing protein [Maribacter algarum]